MERTIFDIMTENPAKIAEFERACDELAATQYILVEGRISAILQCIATSKTLYSLFDRILLKFDYKGTAKECTQGGQTRIKLPASIHDATAFVFCVLLDLDKHNIELKDFLQFYQEGEDTPAAFKAFVRDFVLPFKANVLTILQNEKDEKAAKQSKEDKENERRRLELNFDRFMGTFIARINSDEGLSTILKDDLSVLCGDFMEAVHSDDAKESRNTYSRLIKKLRLHKPALAKELEKFDIDSI